jgi:hypothetical protein
MSDPNQVSLRDAAIARFVTPHRHNPRCSIDALAIFNIIFVS